MRALEKGRSGDRRKPVCWEEASQDPPGGLETLIKERRGFADW